MTLSSMLFWVLISLAMLLIVPVFLFVFLKLLYWATLIGCVIGALCFLIKTITKK